MKALYRLTCYTVLTLALLAGCGGAPAIPAPPSASKAVTDLTITAQRELKIKGTRFIVLSPDGQWLAAVRGKSVCIIAVETLADKHCVDTQTGTPDLRSLVWSLDSKRVVFTEDLPRLMLDSDIWLLEVESGQLTNLTQDNVTGSFMKQGKDSGALLDTMPGWSPDGQTVIFSRSDRQAGATTLYRIAVKGGTPEKIITVAGEDPLSVWYSPRWLSNNKLLYTIAQSKLTDPNNGVWVADSSGQNAKQLLAPDSRLGIPIVIDVSARGDRALIWYSAGAQYASDPNFSFFALLDLSSGQTTPLRSAGESKNRMQNAIFSPDGSRLMYVYRSLEDGDTHVVVRDISSGTENTVLTQNGIAGVAASPPTLGLDWVNNDTLYAETGGGAGLWLTLGSK